eukprot:13001399-Alexandrium_andersonii.AAC.1
MHDELDVSQLAIIDEFEAKLSEFEAESVIMGSQVRAAEKVVQVTPDQLDKNHVAESNEIQAEEAEQEGIEGDSMREKAR